MVFVSSLQMNIDKKERKNGTFSPSRQVGTETARRDESCASDRILFSPLGLDMKFVWERYFSYLLNLLPYSWYVMIYSWRHSVVVLTWQLTQFLPVHISCGSFNIKTMYLPGMVCDMFWLIIYNIVFINYKSIFLQHCPISAFGLQRGKGIVDLCSRCLGGTSPPGCAKPASSVAMRIPSVSHPGPSHLIRRHPGSPWITLAPCRPCRLFLPFSMLKLPISAPLWNRFFINPEIRWIGVTQLELPAPKAIVRIAEAEAWCPPSTLCHACQPKILYPRH